MKTKIIKSYTYNVISTEPFDMPLPLEFKLMNGNSLLASYQIHESGRVDYSFNAGSKKPVLTSTNRPLELNDIYFLFGSRVFPDKTPFTVGELERLGLDEYNPYEIIRKTHGIMPIDRYWFKFSGGGEDGELTYKKAAAEFAEYFKVPEPPETPGTLGSSEISETSETFEELEPELVHSFDSIMAQKSHEYTSLNDVNSILSEGKLDVESLAAHIDDSPIIESAFAPAQPSINLEPEPEKPASAPESDSGGGNLSPEAIAALLAGAASESETEPAPEPEKPTPAPESDSGGGNLSPEAIAALLAGAASELETEPASEPEKPASVHESDSG
ncbi:MAG: hypothetical protein FWG83_00940, partial [Oscillospiraceae bacterium]|nr:hypothetical protein [Oscillospiraceae bacterium]